MAVRCEEFEDRLNEILDRRRNPRSDVELRLHAGSCPDCGDLLAGYQALLTGLKRREPPLKSDVVAARVQSRLDVAHRGGAWRERLPLALVAAALVLVAILPGVWSVVGRAPREATGPATLATTAPAGSTRQPEQAAPLAVLARVAGDQFRFLAVHSEQSAALAWRLVPSVEDVIEGIEGSVGPRPRPGELNPDDRTRPRNPSAIEPQPSAS